MTIRSDEAQAMLKDVESVVAKVKQSRIYRCAALIIILWGVVDLVRDLLIAVDPRQFAPWWFLIDLCGVAGTILLLRRSGVAPGRFPSRIFLAFALIYGFGYLWSHGIGHFGPRQLMAFWPTLFLLGYTLAGLWLGAAFAAIGLGLTALIVAGYFWAGEAFPLWMAGATGLGFILCGFWMRRA